MKNLILISSLLLSFNLFAKIDEQASNVNEYFEILSHDSTYFEPDGAICERVALHEVTVLYPTEQFEILNGLQYDDKKTTIGELDLVIFDRSTGLVEAIAEVKCWKSFEGALKKVKDQRNRFKLYLDRNITISDEDGKKYSKDLFKNVKRYFSISQKGGMDHGFDFELSLTLKELEALRRMLLNCAAEGKCPR